MITPRYIDDNKSDGIFVSVILPVRNEQNHIQATLEALINQDFPKNNYEIIIVDGASIDNTVEIVEGMKGYFPAIRIVSNPKKIVPSALNLAIRCAVGNIILRIDGHTIIAQDYVRNCIETLYHTGADNVGGCMIATGTTNFGQAVAIATSTPFGVGNSKFHYIQTEEEVDSVYMGAWPKKVFSKIGLFDEELVRDQDDEFNYRLREKGGKIILNPKIKSLYTTRSTPISLWKQYFQYGFWKVRILQKHPKQMSIRQFIPPLFVLSLLISIFLTIFTILGKWILLLIAGSYLIANIFASLITAGKKGWECFFLLPVTFVIIHLSYGLGFLVGLVKFSNRWGDKQGKVPSL